MRRGLVLGGGGVTGIAWEIGLLTALEEAGVDVRSADLVVGTSAGSVVGAQVTSGFAFQEWYAAQLAPPSTARPASISRLVLLRYAVALLRSHGDVEELGRRLGAWSVSRAAAGRTPSLASRYDAITERLPGVDWPAAGRLVVTTVDADSGELVTFSGTDGTSLRDAVTASCAVPGVYPPTPVGGRTLVDGGARSGTNADCDRVLVLAPSDRSIGPIRSAAHQLEGVRHLVVTPDDGSVRAIGKNVLDPANRAASARAGHAQGVGLVDEVRALWSSATAAG